MRHDGAGRGNGWHLAWVKATNLTTGAVAMFKCGRWVDRRRQEDPGIVAVVVALPPDQAAAAGGRRSAKDRLLLGSPPGLGAKGGVAASAALQAPAPQEVQGQADLGGSMHLAEAGSMEGLGGAAALPGYRVVFHTSRMCGSGTHAKVHFELTGSRGSSGVLHPVGTSKSFGAGRMDVFEYPVSLGAACRALVRTAVRLLQHRVAGYRAAATSVLAGTSGMLLLPCDLHPHIPSPSPPLPATVPAIPGRAAERACGHRRLWLLPRLAPAPAGGHTHPHRPSVAVQVE